MYYDDIVKENGPAVKEKEKENMKRRIELKKEKGSVWVTDEAQTARRLRDMGECVLFLLVEGNPDSAPYGIDWCAQVPREALESAGDRLEKWLAPDFLEKVWRRHVGLPWQILDTERLCLREMTPEDTDSVFALYRDPSIAREMENLPQNKALLREKIKADMQYMYGFFGFGIWIVERKEEREKTVVGLAGLQVREGEEEPELGFCIARTHRKKEYAKEACRAVLHYGFTELELPAVRAVIRRENVVSLRLCRELGFTKQPEQTDPRLFSLRLSSDQFWAAALAFSSNSPTACGISPPAPIC